MSSSSQQIAPIMMLEMTLLIIGIIALIASISTLARVRRGVPDERRRKNKIEPFIPRCGELNIQSLKPSPQPAFKKDAEFHMTMGLRKLDEKNWLTIDRNTTITTVSGQTSSGTITAIRMMFCNAFLARRMLAQKLWRLSRNSWLRDTLRCLSSGAAQRVKTGSATWKPPKCSRSMRRIWEWPHWRLRQD